MTDSNTNLIKYVRIQGREPAYRTGMPVGIFAAVHRIQESGLLTDEEKAVYHEIDQVWFQENLPNPPFYDDDKPGKPITWFKTATAGFMVEKLQPLIDILEKYAKPYDIVYTNFPGRIVYEDEWQVAVYNDKTTGSISSLSVSHLPLYADVIRRSFSTVASELNLTRDNCPYHPAFVTDEELMELFKDGYYPFGYFSNGKMIGFSSIKVISGSTYGINHVSVLPEYRNAGLGQSLLDYCITKVRDLGGNKIIIEIVEDCAGIGAWYAANGFVHMGFQKYEHLPITLGNMELKL